ncbi:MAG: hypothetical protein PVH80_07400 [Anaerolineae bacterium]|jgi:hypothetical protein
MNRKVVAGVLAGVLLLATVVPGLAQATDKTFWTNFTLVNLGDGPAAGEVEYVTTAGGDWGSESFTIPEAGGQAIFRQYATAGDPGNPNLTEGNGSVVVSADQPLGAVVQILARGQDPTSSGAYSGFEAGDTSFYVPLAAKELATASGLANSQIVVQNTGGAAADVEIELIASNGATTYIADGGSLAAGASWYYDLAEESDSNVPDSWYGSAVASTDTAGASIVVVSNFFTGDAMQTFNAFGAAAPGTFWAVPLFTSRLGNSLSTPIAVQNLSGSSIPVGGVDVECQPDPSVGGSPISMSNTAAIGNSASYFFNPVTDMSIPTGFYGACTIESTANVVAFVQMRFVDTGEAASYEAMKAGGTKASIPLVAKRLGNGFATAATIQNLSTTSAATVDITYIPSPDYTGSSTPLQFNDVSIPAGGSLIHNHRVTTGAVASMPVGWFGTMVVESEGPDINAFVQLTFMPSINPGLPGGDNFMAHNAFTSD